MNGELFDEIPGTTASPIGGFDGSTKGRMEAIRADPNLRQAMSATPEDGTPMHPILEAGSRPASPIDQAVGGGADALDPNSYDNTQAQETMRFVNDLLAKGFTQAQASKLALNTFPPPTKREAMRIKAAELPTASDLAISEESTLLELMETGRTYTIAQLLELFPRDHRVWQKETTLGKFIATGTIMANLVTLGKVEKIKNRHALYKKRKESKPLRTRD